MLPVEAVREEGQNGGSSGPAAGNSGSPAPPDCRCRLRAGRDELMLNDLLYRLRALFRREAVENEMEEELRFHLECEATRNTESGMDSGDAHHVARRVFGGIDQTREECRDARGTRFVEDILQDCRYAIRMIRKNVVFSALAVFALALSIGADTAVFSIVHEVLLKPLPFRDPSKLLVVWDTYLPQYAKFGISPPELQSWQAQHDVFRETAWYRSVPRDGNLRAPGAEAVAVHADFISADLFPLLGAQPLIGRGFAPAEGPDSAILSERLWRTAFARNPGIVGTTFRFDGSPFTVVGVMPSEMQFPDWADLWFPKGPLLADELTNPVRHALGFVIRPGAGIGEKQAMARLLTISKRLAAEHPGTSTGWGIRVAGLQDDLTQNVRPALLLLLGAASLLLLIACADIASLLLSRASGRAREMAVRAAMGASSLRIGRQLVTESLVLALLGGVCGFLFAKTGLMLALPERARMEPAVLLFLLVISLVTGTFFGMAPAIYAVRADPQSVMKSAAVTSAGMRTRSALVVFEFALTLALAIGAGILARSYVLLMRVDPGFSSRGVLTLRIQVPPSRKPESLFHNMQQRLLSLPGVQAFAVANALPLIANRANASRFNVPGSPLINPDALPTAQIRTASPDYFQAMKIPLRSGRAFSERDLNQPVVIVNQTMAKRFWPGRDPVGLKFITGPWGANPVWSTIVGVAADVRQFGLDSEPTLDLYYPSLAAGYLIVKTTGDPLTLAAGVERALHAMDPDLALSDIRSMDRIAAESARNRRWTMGLLAAFAALAFLLALVGIYGVMLWSVAQRTREFGIRMALGAQKRQLMALVLRHGIRLAAAGLALGTLASLALRRVLSSLVYGVSTGDPLIYVSVPALMLAVALFACCLPAREAGSVDPSISLRYD
jgi:putative ABC transport system permease protein